MAMKLNEINKQIYYILNKADPNQHDLNELKKLFKLQLQLLKDCKETVHYIEIENKWLN